MWKLTEFEKGYMVGIIEGEGYLGIVKHHSKQYGRGFCWSLKLGVTNTRPEIIHAVKKICHRTGGVWRTHKKYTNQKPVMDILIYPKTLEWLLPQLKGRFFAKERQVQLCLEAIELLKHSHSSKKSPYKSDERLEEIYRELRMLNSGRLDSFSKRKVLGANGKVYEGWDS